MRIFLLLLSIFSISLLLPIKSTYAACCPTTCTKCGCPGAIGTCEKFCSCVSKAATGLPDQPLTTIGHVTDEFKKHRDWMIKAFFLDSKEGDPVGLLAAMKLMTEQLATTGMHQVKIIGTFFDAKHQLETQRLFQQLTAQAHKDYHPSEEVCVVGTATRSLASSQRNTDLAAIAFGKRITDRQLLSKDTATQGGYGSDEANRLVQFIKKYCNKDDMATNLNWLCTKSENTKKLFNRDVSYTATIENPLTLNVDFTSDDPQNTEEEDAFFALTSNLFSNQPFPATLSTVLKHKNGDPRQYQFENLYMDARSIIAKRSVAANSIGSIAALKAKGDEESQPFIYAILEEMSLDADDKKGLSATDIENFLGDRPSYFAQMEVLTKLMYQWPNFYANLYDKPANVLRQNVGLQAITLMQKRDLYRSYLRSEMTLATMLEAALIKEQERISNEVNPRTEGGG